MPAAGLNKTATPPQPAVASCVQRAGHVQPFLPAYLPSSFVSAIFRCGHVGLFTANFVMVLAPIAGFVAHTKMASSPQFEHTWFTTSFLRFPLPPPTTPTVPPQMHQRSSPTVIS